jgi:hypothetical protein
VHVTLKNRGDIETMHGQIILGLMLLQVNTLATTCTHANDLHACSALHVLHDGCVDVTAWCWGVGVLQDVAAVMAMAIIPAFDKNEVPGDTKTVHL